MSCLKSIYIDALPWVGTLFALINIVFLIVLLWIAFWKPALLPTKALFVFVVLGAVIGQPLQLYGILNASMVPLMIGGLLASTSGMLGSVLIYVALTSLELRNAGLIIVASYLVCEIVKALFSQFASIEASLAVMLFMQITAPIYIFGIAKPILEHAQNSEAPAFQRLTDPSSAISLLSPLFISIFAFPLVFVYAFSHPDYHASLTNAAPVLFFLLLLIIAIKKKTPLSIDRLFSFSAFCTIAGCLALNTMPFPDFSVASALLNVGNNCFKITWVLVLVLLCQRNAINSFGILTWGVVLNLMGDLTGMLLGNATHHAPEASFFIISTFVLFLAFAAFRSNLSAIIQQVTEPIAVHVPVKETASVEQRVSFLAKKHSLTSREEEVLSLLARGRNAAIIQKELQISYNTARVHISHIYEKLDIHSHQELIDLVDASDAMLSQ